MKILIPVVVVIAVIALVVFLLKSRKSDESLAYTTIEQIPTIVAKLQQTGKDSSFVVFMFQIQGNSDELFPNLQYSIENGKVGFDWVLIAPQNIKDEGAISAFVTNQGYVPSKREMNGVRFVRVEGTGIENLGVKVLRDFYHLAPDTKLELIVDGFDLKH
ncbi:MAG: hypothetical protein ABL959_02005 [Pyrinomonadaceae bacterium]